MKRSTDASVRAAVARSREARLRAVERRLVGNLRYLRRHDRAGYEAMVGMLRRGVERHTLVYRIQVDGSGARVGGSSRLTT